MTLPPALLRRVGAPVLVVLLSTVLLATDADARVVGSDVASWQHPKGAAISWTSVRHEGHRFVFVKATEGRDYRNPYFRHDWRHSHDAGLIHGAYHFARPNRKPHSAQRQARHFVRVAGRAHGHGALPPTLDLEVTGGLGPRHLRHWTHRWLRAVTHRTGRRPMIYSYPYFWAHHMGHTRAFRGYRLWGASYVGRPTTFGGAWKHWTFWQYTSRARVDGIRGKTDMNIFHGTKHRLRRMAHLRHR